MLPEVSELRNEPGSGFCRSDDGQQAAARLHEDPAEAVPSSGEHVRTGVLAERPTCDNDSEAQRSRCAGRCCPAEHTDKGGMPPASRPKLSACEEQQLSGKCA